ncbi:hypothetical protein ACW2QC_00245 [Virgibacillus sp. FSP13]
MSKTRIPIYANKDKGRLGYTVFLDIQTMKVYKAYHKEISQSVYWIGFIAALILMRSLTGVTIDSPFYMIILILGGVTLSVLMGIYIHKNSAGSLKEIYLSNEMINDYLDEGKKRFKVELIFTLIVLLSSIVCIILFLLYHLLIWLLVSFILFLLIGALVCNFSKARFQIYKNGI